MNNQTTTTGKTNETRGNLTTFSLRTLFAATAIFAAIMATWNMLQPTHEQMVLVLLPWAVLGLLTAGSIYAHNRLAPVCLILFVYASYLLTIRYLLSMFL